KVPLGVVNDTAFVAGSSGGCVGSSLLLTPGGGDEVPALVVGGTDGTLGFASGGVGGTAVGLVGATLGSVPAGGGATLGDVVSLAVGAVTGGTLALGSAPGPAEHARTDQTHTATTGAT